MNLEDFQIIDTETIHTFFIKRDFLKLYHQQGTNLDNYDQIIEFSFGESNKYHQIGIAYFQ